MFISFALLTGFNVTLNMVVLFSLILALGMLVDNGIVIVENIYRHMQQGKSRREAALDGTNQVAWPVITSTLTTLGAFSPLMFWPGIMGEFMGYLPMTLIMALSASLFVALVINPVLSSRFQRVKAAAPKGNPLSRRCRTRSAAAASPRPRTPKRTRPGRRCFTRTIAGTGVGLTTSVLPITAPDRQPHADRG